MISASRKRILIVDDEPEICGLCKRVFTKEGFEVDVASNGRIAQAMIRKRKYELYLIDIKMPLMDGKELYEWFQEAYPDSIGKVVFTTGSAFSVETESFIQSYGRFVLQKPFTNEELISTIKEVLRRVE
ncbi:MAG: response regulator [bacterium]|nr:response regulator [bacterium]